jgi:pimeloyl-ACP methyl ester carboxylesterase
VGNGDLTLFIHALGQRGSTWGKVIDQCAKHLTCFNLDLPGFYRSDIPPRQYSVEDYVKAILDVMDEIGSDRLNLVGDHTGSLLALVLASNHPDRVNKLVLDGLPYWNKEQGKALWEKFFLPMFTDKASYHLPVLPLSTWREAKESNPELQRKEWQKADEIRRRSRLWSRMSLEAISKYDSTSDGPNIDQPTLLIYGDGDKVRRTETQAHKDIKRSVLKVIPESPGPVGRYQPDTFAKLVVEFLSN